jgi:dihydropteroate synthase
MAPNRQPTAPRFWKAGRFSLSLAQPLVMAIVNLTPDSFSGDGVAGDPVAAVARAEAAVTAGAAILDLGAESTRPGAQPVPVEEEWARLQPVLRIVRNWPVAISVDSRKPEVMARAVAEGADILNDVTGFRDDQAVAVAVRCGCGLCVMHMQGEPQTMQLAPHYDDVVAEVRAFLTERTQALISAGVAAERIVWDPGFGFGKTLAHNLALFQALHQFAREFPLLIGVSRKRMIGEITGQTQPADRVIGSVAAALKAVTLGASIVRVHDVAATVEALKVWQALGDPLI